MIINRDYDNVMICYDTSRSEKDKATLVYIALVQEWIRV